METSIIIAAALGAMVYFILEFKAKGYKLSDFSIKFWLKDNLLNLITTAGFIWVYLYIKDGLTKEMAFAIGFGWNKIQDYFQDLVSKKS